MSNPRAGSGTESGKNRGVAHAPDPLSTVTRDGRRAAQNAARIEDDAHLQPAGVQSLACRAAVAPCLVVLMLLDVLTLLIRGDNHRVLSRPPSRRQQFDYRWLLARRDHVCSWPRRRVVLTAKIDLMKRRPADILKEALALPAEARAALAGQLLDSLDPPSKYNAGSSRGRDIVLSNDFAQASIFSGRLRRPETSCTAARERLPVCPFRAARRGPKH